jgi:hypothetical protein
MVGMRAKAACFVCVCFVKLTRTISEKSCLFGEGLVCESLVLEKQANESSGLKPEGTRRVEIACLQGTLALHGSTQDQEHHEDLYEHVDRKSQAFCLANPGDTRYTSPSDWLPRKCACVPFLCGRCVGPV